MQTELPPAQVATTPGDRPEAAPKPALTVFDAAAIIVGIVVGAGIFRLPPLVAANSPNEWAMMAFWVGGGLISLIGALCYAELSSAYPNTGGDYHFLTRSFGQSISFLFAWARMTVIQTGAIAIGAFLVGDYATRIWDLGAHSSAIYAALVVALLTAINMTGVRQGKLTQYVFTVPTVLGLLFVAAAGIAAVAPGGTPAPAPVAEPSPAFGGAIGLAFVFILYTYGGWNEAAYLSAEVKNGRRPMLKALLLGIGAITLIYLIANLAYLRGLGFEGMRQSEAVAADLLALRFGETAAIILSGLIIVAAVSTTNATMITGARSNYALGRDFRIFGFLGQWRERGNTPSPAFLLQGVIALALVGLGAATAHRQQGSGLEAMVDYTAPVFWFFFLLVGLSVFILRHWDGARERPFKVPLYPATPLVFCFVCIYMLYSSLAYTGVGAFFGVGVLIIGVPLLLLARAFQPTEERQSTTSQGGPS
jgi:basic amino acid/polyamine antiporter, APA family